MIPTVVGGIVQNLDVELVLGVVQLAVRLRIREPGVHLIVHGELHRDHGQFLEVARRRHAFVAVFAEEVEIVETPGP